MIDTVYNLLLPLGVPVKWNKAPDIKNVPSVISYHFFNEDDILHGDGKGVSEGGSLQVDVFSKTNYTNIVNFIKVALTAAGFLFAGSNDTTENLDSNTMIYHKVMIFNYAERKVLQNVQN